MPTFLRLLALAGLCFLASCSSTPKTTENTYRGRPAVIVNDDVVPPDNVPAVVKRAIAAGNLINHLPYQFGGGHGHQPNVWRHFRIGRA